MKTIAYYVSDYGYGHGTRSVAIMRQLLKDANVRIIVSTSFPMPIIQAAFGNVTNSISERIQYRYNVNDLGFITKPNSIEIDMAEMNRQYAEYIETLDDRVKKEVEFLGANQVDIVMSDISPIPFLAAKERNITSIGVSNFTWYTAYHQIIEEEKLLPLKKAYESMDYFFALAADNEPNWPRIEIKQFGFFAREFNQNVIDSLLQQHNPTGKFKLVYFGLGMKIDVDQMQQFPLLNDPKVKLIVSSNLEWVGKNIIRIPKDEAETQHYVAISDVVITKPGWGTVGEAVTYNKPLVILKRSHMQEDENTIQYLMNYQRCMLINWDDLFQLRLTDERMESLQQQVDRKQVKKMTPNNENEAERIARTVLESF